MQDSLPISVSSHTDHALKVGSSPSALPREEAAAWSLKGGYGLAKLKHVTDGNAQIKHTYNSGFLEISSESLCII